MNDIAHQYALSHLGVPYVWGGNNRLEGMDCGALVAEVLRSQGLVKPREDMNAQMLFQRFGTLPAVPPSRGALIFYGASPQSVKHVAIALDSLVMLEAGGGGQGFDRTLVEAKKGMGAMVRIRPITAASFPHLKTVMPPWPK